MSASSRLDLDNELNRNDETRNNVDFEDGDFPAIKHNCDLIEHARHMVTGVGYGDFPCHPREPTAPILRNEPTSPPIVNMKQVSPPLQPHEQIEPSGWR